MVIDDSKTFTSTAGTLIVARGGAGAGGDGAKGWVNPGGTFNHNFGTVKVTADADTELKENDWFNITMNPATTTRVYSFRDTTGNTIRILGDLTITTGEFELYTATDTLAVHGNTYIAANGKFNNDANQTGGTITHHGLVTNLGTYKIDDIHVTMNGGMRQLGTLTWA